MEAMEPAVSISGRFERAGVNHTCSLEVTPIFGAFRFADGQIDAVQRQRKKALSAPLCRTERSSNRQHARTLRGALATCRCAPRRMPTRAASSARMRRLVVPVNVPRCDRPIAPGAARLPASGRPQPLCGLPFLQRDGEEAADARQQAVHQIRTQARRRSRHRSPQAAANGLCRFERD